MSKTVMKTTIFQDNDSQMLRIPKEMALPPDTTTVVISRYGNGLLISREGKYWKDFFDERAKDPIDFPDRDQPAMQEREDLDI